MMTITPSPKDQSLPIPKRGGRVPAVYRNLLILTVLAFLSRLLVAYILDNGLANEYKGDEGDYVTLASHLVQNKGFADKNDRLTSYRTPGLPLLLVPVVAIGGPDRVAIRVFMCLVGSLLIPACYLAGESVTGSKKMAWMAAVVALAFPTWVVSSSSVLTDVPAAILVTSMVWLLSEGQRRESVLWIGGAGIALGAAALVRPVSLVYAPGIAIWLSILMVGWKRRLVSIAAIGIPLIIMFTPWALRNRQVHGELVWVSTQGGSELYKSNNPEATGIVAIDHEHFEKTLQEHYPRDRFPNEAVRSRLFRAEAVSFIRENPLRFAQLCVIRFVQLWKVYSPRVPVSESLAVIASFGLALPFFLIQIIRRGWRPGPEMLLVLIIMCHTAVHMVFTSAIRYRIPIEPLVILLAIQGFYWALSRVQSRFGEVHRYKVQDTSVRQNV